MPPIIFGVRLPELQHARPVETRLMFELIWQRFSSGGLLLIGKLITITFVNA
jgi:hypothetical protein